MGDVYDVGEVKEVGVVTKLETSAVRVMHIEDRGQDLHVAFAKDAGGADGAGQECGGAVGSNYEGFRFGLGVC